MMERANGSYGYIRDTYGDFRENRKTRFSDIEAKAKEQIGLFAKGRMSDRDFALAFDEVRKEFHQCMKIKGMPTIDEDTPLWLNSFIGLHFLDWYKYQQLKWYYKEHFREITAQDRANFEKLREEEYDERFLRICKQTAWHFSKWNIVRYIPIRIHVVGLKEMLRRKWNRSRLVQWLYRIAYQDEESI